MPHSISEEELLLSPSGHEALEVEAHERSLKQTSRLYLRPDTATILASTLGLSLFGGLAVFVGYTWAAATVGRGCISPLANLVPDTQVPFAVPSYYGSDVNVTLTDELWASTNTETGMVALPKSLKLHPTETFPWDPAKGVYMLNGYHGLHCLKLLYTSLRQYQLSIPQTQPSEHLVHCLGALRSDVICTADDTPRFAGEPVPGDSFEQIRTCRDWKRLERWAEGHSACFKRLNIKDPRYGSLHEWKSCPEGSPYRDIVKDYFESRGEI